MTTSTATGFSSVKLPAALVQQAREAAQPMRRSAAGQIEYWATLGQVIEHQGLSVQEARTAIEGYEAAAHQLRQSLMLDDIEARFTAAEASGSLADRLRDVVSSNRSKAFALQKAA